MILEYVLILVLYVSRFFVHSSPKGGGGQLREADLLLAFGVEIDHEGFGKLLVGGFYRTLLFGVP